MIRFSMDWLNLDGNGAVLSTLLYTCLAATWLAAIVVVICLIAGRWIGPRQRSWLWLIVAIRLALPVAPEFAGSMQLRWFATETQPSARNDAVDAKAWTVIETPDDSRANLVPQSPTKPSYGGVNFQERVRRSILLAWFVGMLACAGWMVWTIVRCRRRLRGLPSTSDPRLIAMLEVCRTLLPLRRKVELLIVTGLRSPALTGIFRPRILLPDDVARSFSDDEIQQILLHEMVHIRRNDLAINAFLSLMQILHWWNPTFWFVRGRLLRERELACDESVIRTLGVGQANSYGRTLIRIVERLSDAARETWKPGMEGIMLVSIVGRTAAIKARLRRLPRAAHPVHRVTRLFAWGIVIFCTVAGLTDAQQKDSAESAPYGSSQFVLPASAQFHMTTDDNDSSKNGKSSEELIARTYLITDLLDRMERELHLNRDEARKELMQFVSTYAQLIDNSSHNDGSETENNQNQENLVLIFEDHSLVVRATPRAHKRIRELLEIRRAHGFQKITFEVRWLEMPVDLIDALNITGGAIYSTLAGEGHPSQFDDLASERETADVLSPLQGRSKTTITAPMPLYMRLLDADTTKRVMQFAQGHERSNILFAPKVTAFAGQEAEIRNELTRPFVVGLRPSELPSSDSADSAVQQRQPEIMQVPDGWKLRIMGFHRNDTNKIHLRCEFTESRITDVARGTVGQGPGQSPLKIQIPSVMRQVSTAAADIAPGDTLLLHPIEGSTEPDKESTTRNRRYMLLKPQLTSP